MNRYAVTLALCLAAAATAWGFTVQQAAQGKQLYTRQCAGCHGARGEGGRVSSRFGPLAGWEAPALVGQGALPESPPATRRIRGKPFRTAFEVFDFSRATMPAQAPGSLSEEDYLAITAHLLQANGAAPGGRPLTARSAAAVRLRPAR